MTKEDYFMPVVLLILVPLFLLSLLSITFNGFYQPIRLSLTGQMTPLMVVKKNVRINFGRNGPYDINYAVWVKEHEGLFPVKSELFDGIIEGETTQVFYSPELKWGIVSNKPFGWWGAMLSDSYHKPYTTFFGFVIIVSWMMAFGLKRLIRESLIVYSKYRDKHANERDHLIRKISVAGALVPYAVIVVFVYLISLYAMYAVFLRRANGFIYDRRHCWPCNDECVYVTLFNFESSPYFKRCEINETSCSFNKNHYIHNRHLPAARVRER